ncbi:serpin family protein [uncultured Senegalimassilia sp.]|uniref:serpin family protein n=1 Tax=uncultured Senegalimassilia sp. TaxID=1714350 RepID=UPI0025D186C6|nr:serpin family protein [uncultured Senegalimassilia sp.]
MHSDSALNRWSEPRLMSIAARLLKDGFTGADSFVMSPACLYAALEMLARGAEGKTLEELESVLGNAETRQEACSLLFAATPKHQTPSNYRLSIATSLWANKHSAPLRSSFSRATADINGQVAEVDFASPGDNTQMSAWLDRNTGSKFNSAPEFDTDTLFAIISALYFKDNWVDRLEDEEVEMTFNIASGPTVTMMGGFGLNGHLLSDNRATAVSWPMESGAAVVFAKPTDAAAIGDFIGSGEAWDAIMRCRKRIGTTQPAGGIELLVPELEIESDDQNLKETLRAMGIARAFTIEAELGGITKAGAMISEVIQSAKLALDQNGAEGAAYTVIAADIGCIPEPMPDSVRVVFDQPFAFAVFSRSGAPLFTGAYMGP